MEELFQNPSGKITNLYSTNGLRSISKKKA